MILLFKIKLTCPLPLTPDSGGNIKEKGGMNLWTIGLVVVVPGMVGLTDLFHTYMISLFLKNSRPVSEANPSSLLIYLFGVTGSYQDKMLWWFN